MSRNKLGLVKKPPSHPSHLHHLRLPPLSGFFICLLHLAIFLHTTASAGRLPYSFPDIYHITPHHPRIFLHGICFPKRSMHGGGREYMLLHLGVLRHGGTYYRLIRHSLSLHSFLPFVLPLLITNSFKSNQSCR